jgi:hypothetical protein
MTQRAIPIGVVRIVRAAEGGWYVIAGPHGWLHGDRASALAEKRWLDLQRRRVP